MFKINRKIEYALIALKYMNAKGEGGLTTAKEICNMFHTPFDPTSRVLQILAQHHVVKAEQGAHGGYRISCDLAKMTMKDLTNIIIGKINIANCLSGDYAGCDLVSCCSVIAPMLNLNERIAKLFEVISVKELIQSKNALEKEIRLKPVDKRSTVDATI